MVPQPLSESWGSSELKWRKGQGNNLLQSVSFPLIMQDRLEKIPSVLQIRKILSHLSLTYSAGSLEKLKESRPSSFPNYSGLLRPICYSGEKTANCYLNILKTLTDSSWEKVISIQCQSHTHKKIKPSIANFSFFVTNTKELSCSTNCLWARTMQSCYSLT